MKLLLQVAARGGAGDDLGPALISESDHLATQGATSVRVLRQMADDPFGNAIPGVRPFQGTIDARFDDVETAGTAVEGLAERLAPLVHVDLSCAFVGEDHVFIPSDVPVRLQYVMRRRIGTTHESYVDYYFKHHSRFGFLTKGIAGYVQFHIDPEASHQMAERSGFGLWAADSVSELHGTDLKTMLAGFYSNPELFTESQADEELFIDRANSAMFISEEIQRT
jgi:hypothetical protein